MPPKLDVTQEGALTRRRRLEDTILLGDAPFDLKRKTAKEVGLDVRKYLLKAHDAKLIDEPLNKIYGMFKSHAAAGSVLEKISPPMGKYHSIAIGDSRNMKRDRNLPHLTRSADGAWFDFQILLDEHRAGVSLVSYDFELRLRDVGGHEYEVPWIRYDLNGPGHENQFDAMRSHCHLGSDDDGLSAPAPMMSPFQLLDLFVHGLRSIGRGRHTSLKNE